MRAHLQSVYQQTGELPRELANLPELPEPVAYLWRWFEDLSAARGSNGFGVEPIAYAEIDAWARLTGKTLDAWEVRALRELDGVFINAVQSEK